TTADSPSPGILPNPNGVPPSGHLVEPRWDSCDDRYAEGVAQQSPGSRSAPWEGRTGAKRHDSLPRPPAGEDLEIAFDQLFELGRCRLVAGRHHVLEDQVLDLLLNLSRDYR